MKQNRSGSEPEQDASDTVFAKLPSEKEVAEAARISSPVTIFTNGLRIELSDGCPSDMMDTLLRVLRSNV